MNTKRGTKLKKIITRMQYRFQRLLIKSTDVIKDSKNLNLRSSIFMHLFSILGCDWVHKIVVGFDINLLIRVLRKLVYLVSN